MIRIVFLILCVIIILGIIYLIFKKKDSKGGNIWEFKKPNNQCNLKNKFLKSSLSSSPRYTGINPSKSILNMPIKPNSDIFKRLRYLKGIKDDDTVPDNFSWRYYKDSMIEDDRIEKARNQGGCGGCWAFAITSCMGDRIAIQNGIKSPKPSVTYLLSECSISSNNACASNQGCDGANAYNILYWLQNNSQNALETCWPFIDVVSNSQKYGGSSNYLAPSSLNNNNLKNCCYDCCYPDNNKLNISSPSFSVKNGSIQYFGQPMQGGDKQYTQDKIDSIILEIQKEIMTNGPVVSCFVVLDNFETFYYTNDSKSIYSNDTVVMDIDGCEFNDCRNIGYTNYGHSVCITGWGTDPDTGKKYWEVRNSWGELWADGGYCKIAFTTYDTLKYYIGIDIPIVSYTTDNYFGGVISFTPNNIDNLDQLITDGIFEKSQFNK
jgi:C1A family cysteine protease